MSQTLENPSQLTAMTPRERAWTIAAMSANTRSSIIAEIADETSRNTEADLASRLDRAFLANELKRANYTAELAAMADTDPHRQ